MRSRYPRARKTRSWFPGIPSNVALMRHLIGLFQRRMRFLPGLVQRRRLMVSESAFRKMLSSLSDVTRACRRIGVNRFRGTSDKRALNKTQVHAMGIVWKCLRRRQLRMLEKRGRCAEIADSWSLVVRGKPADMASVAPQKLWLTIPPGGNERS